MRWWVLSVALVLGTACGPKVVRQPIYESAQVAVVLRHSIEDGEPVSHGYEHPVTISGVRVAHILASFSFEDRKGHAHPLVRTGHVYDLAEGISDALGKATPADEVIAVASAHDRRLGIFSDRRVTSFRCMLEQGQLRFEFYAIEFDWKDDDPRSEEYTVPLALPQRKPPFRLVPGQAQALAGPRGLLVDWRDPFFRRPVNLSIRHGQVRRRTILMEAEPEDEAIDPLPGAPASTQTNAQVQALDQLDAARRAGILPEAEFQRRRRLILQGRLEEAGYGADPQ